MSFEQINASGNKTLWSDEFTTRYDGTFDYFQFYINMFEFLIEWGYVDTKSYRYMETYWSEVHSDVGKEIWWWWKTDRMEEGNPFWKFHLDFVFQLKKLKEVEVIEDGKKLKAFKGQARVYIKPRLIIDEDNTWDDHWLLRNKFIQNLFLFRLWLKKRNQKIGIMINDTNKAMNFIRQYFELQPYTGAMQDAFFKSHGLKERYQ